MAAVGAGSEWHVVFRLRCFPQLSRFSQGSAANGPELTGQLHFILGTLDVLDSRFASWLRVPSAIQGGNPCS